MSRRRTEARSAHALLQSAPGRYEGKFTPAGRGIHFVTLFAEGDAGQAPSSVATIPYVAPYPKEYRELRPNLALLGRLAEETGGEMLDPENLSAGLKRLYTPSPGAASRGHETLVAARRRCAAPVSCRSGDEKLAAASANDSCSALNPGEERFTARSVTSPGSDRSAPPRGTPPPWSDS